MRNRVTYLLGTGVSSLGDGMQTIAISWMMLQLTGSAMAIGGVIAVNYLPALLLAPWAGVYSDHQDAKRLAVLVDCGRMIAAAGMALLVLFHVQALWLIYVLQALLAVGNTMFKPASQTLVKETFADGELVKVLTSASSLNQLATFIGSGLAGLLVAVFSPILCLLLNAGSYLVSAMCNSSLQRVSVRKTSSARYSVREELRGGWTFLRGKRGMLYLLGLSLVSSACLQMTNTILAPYVKEDLHGTSTMYALFDVTFTIGGVLSGMLVSRVLRKWGPYACGISLAGIGLFSLAAGWQAGVWLAVATVFGLGFSTMLHLTTLQTLLQVNTPKEILGCVVGLRSIAASSTKIAAALTAGALMDAVNIQYVFWGLTAVVLVAFVATAKHIKDVPVPESMRGTVI